MFFKPANRPNSAGESSKPGYFLSVMIRRFAISIVLLSVVSVLITSCASSDSGVVTEHATTTVPGEKVPGEGTLTPNATSGVPSAGVAW